MPILEKWYERKKPTLQIRILKIIALEGESSKRKLQRSLNAHYPDISDAVESLKKHKIVKWTRADLKTRRAEIYYKLTRQGLKAIIEEFSDPEVFWKAIASYCRLSKHPISLEEFDMYYKAFEAKYVGYFRAHDFSFNMTFSMNYLVNG